MNFYYYYFFHYYIWIDVVILLLDKAPRQQRILMYPEQAQKVTAKMCCGDPLCLLWVPVFYFQGGLLRHRRTDIRHQIAQAHNSANQHLPPQIPEIHRQARPSRPMERTKRAATWKLIRFQHMHCLVNSPDKLKVKSLARLILQSAGRSWHRFSRNALAAACPWGAQSCRSAATPLANHSSNSWVVPLRGPTPMALKGTFPGCSRSI